MHRTGWLRPAPSALQARGRSGLYSAFEETITVCVAGGFVQKPIPVNKQADDSSPRSGTSESASMLIAITKNAKNSQSFEQLRNSRCLATFLFNLFVQKRGCLLQGFEKINARGRRGSLLPRWNALEAWE